MPLDGAEAAARWPRFVPRALAASVTAVAAVPLHTSDLKLGALNLISTGPPLPGQRDLAPLLPGRAPVRRGAALRPARGRVADG
ncbi:hypothetical protein [Streptomyces sp. NPDC016845]|uniref:hypothetical protein n=1 Tax=Streptomyces sp. NPDC016845 TaxID=3364972 RepID=UPI0037ADA180